MMAIFVVSICLVAAAIYYCRKIVSLDFRCYLPTADFVDKRSIEKVGCALLSMVQVGMVKTLHLLKYHV